MYIRIAETSSKVLSRVRSCVRTAGAVSRMTGARAGMMEALGMEFVEVIEDSASFRVFAE